MLVQSRITQKYQATIPLLIREALHLGKGDAVAFEFLEDGEIVIRKADTPLDIQFAEALSGSLQEWASDADAEAFNDL